MDIIFTPTPEKGILGWSEQLETINYPPVLKPSLQNFPVPCLWREFDMRSQEKQTGLNRYGNLTKTLSQCQHDTSVIFIYSYTFVFLFFKAQCNCTNRRPQKPMRTTTSIIHFSILCLVFPHMCNEGWEETTTVLVFYPLQCSVFYVSLKKSEIKWNFRVIHSCRLLREFSLQFLCIYKNTGKICKQKRKSVKWQIFVYYSPFLLRKVSFWSNSWNHAHHLTRKQTNIQISSIYMCTFNQNEHILISSLSQCSRGERLHMSRSYILKHTHTYPVPPAEHRALKINKTQHVLYQIFFISQGINFCTNISACEGCPHVKQRLSVWADRSSVLPVTMFLHAGKIKTQRCFLAGWVGWFSSEKVSQLVSHHVSALKCALVGINLNKTIKSQESLCLPPRLSAFVWTVWTLWMFLYNYKCVGSFLSSQVKRN